MNRCLPFRYVITSLHISSILTCPSSVSWLYIIFHMKINIYKYLFFFYLAHENKNLHSNVFSELSGTLHTVLPTSAPPTPNLLYPLQICSTHIKFTTTTPNLLRPLIFRHLAHVSTLYQYKTRTHKSCFFCQTQINILIRYSPHPLRSLILHNHSAAHSPHHSTHSYTVLDKGGKMHMKQSPYQLHPQQFLSSSSSFYIMLDMCIIIIMVCFKLLYI